MKTLISIIDLGNPTDIKKTINKVSNQCNEILVMTNSREEYNDKVKILPFEQANWAVNKNSILKYAKNSQFDYCFIIESNIEVIEPNIIKLYINLIEQFKLGLVMYGYGPNSPNMILGNRAHPSVIVKIDKDGRELYINRQPCSSLMLFKIADDMSMFDERLQILETDFICVDMEANKKLINGFHIDLANSNSYFKNVDTPIKRVKNDAMANADIQLRGGSIKLENNVDVMLDYIKKYI